MVEHSDMSMIFLFLPSGITILFLGMMYVSDVKRRFFIFCQVFLAGFPNVFFTPNVYCIVILYLNLCTIIITNYNLFKHNR